MALKNLSREYVLRKRLRGRIVQYESSPNQDSIVGLQNARREEIARLIRIDPSLRSKSYRDEIAHDAFVRCQERLEKDPSRATDKSEMKKSLNNVAKTFRRRKDRLQQREVLLPEGGVDKISQNRVEFPNWLVILNVEISRLPPKLKAIIQLHYFESYTCQEIADELSISRATVHRYLGSALRALRVSLTETEF